METRKTKKKVWIKAFAIKLPQIKLVLFVIGILTVQAFGASDYDVEVQPANPTTADIVYVTLSSDWFYFCPPYDISSQINGSNIFVKAIADAEMECPQIAEPWEQTANLGRLAKSTYSLYTEIEVLNYPFPIYDWEYYGDIEVESSVITVDDDGPADFHKIQDAINFAVYGDTVSVASGTYIEYIALKNGVALVGAGKASTVIDGNSNSMVTSCNCDASTVLDGFTITNGGGMYNESSSPTITNCTFEGNFGGGMSNYYSSNPSVTFCTFKGNLANYGGGGMENYNSSSPKIANCMFIGNSAGYGGGICNEYYSEPVIVDCTFSGNSADHGGGMIYDFLSNQTLTNCIFWGDVALFNGDEISYYNVPGITSESVISYCDIAGCGGSGAGWDSLLGIDGGGNIDADPLFADANANDFHLKSQGGRWDQDTQRWVKDSNTSPCIDAGDPNSDWKAELWPNGRRINMGAYGGTPQASMSLSAAGNIADLDNNGDLDFNDVKLFTEDWLKQQVLLAADLDRNGDVNFVDFAIFGNEWYKENAALGMTYQIGGCDLSLSMVEKSEATRFTVTVNGHYIHFADIMVANCCPEKLELEMYVYGVQILLYEKEYLRAHPCICICNYPVTADLGPFGPGTYTLEVYEDYGGFIGTTTVVIE